MEGQPPPPRLLRNPSRAGRRDKELLLIRGNHEAFNRLALNESIHNLRDVRDRDASVKKVIRFD